MKRQQFFRHRLQTLGALQDAVGAMRSLSAHHFRLARQALQAARAYRREMDEIISEVGIQQRAHPGIPPGILVVASDLGLCGDYNSRLARMAVEQARQYAVGNLYCVGRRTRALLAKHSLTPMRAYDAPASQAGISQLLLALSRDVLEDYFSRRVGSLYVISAGFEGVGKFEPLTTRVLPIQSDATRQPLQPSPYVSEEHLKAVVVREFLYITLHEILLDALAAEHGMRLMAAESALEWLDSTVIVTSRRLASARSEAATQELLDIVAGSRQRRNVQR